MRHKGKRGFFSITSQPPPGVTPEQMERASMQNLFATCIAQIKGKRKQRVI